MNREVSIIQRHLAQYRVPLYEHMRARLAGENVTLRLLHGRPSQLDLSKKNDGEIEWAELLPAHYAMDESICWLPYGKQTVSSDLVVVTQENKLIYNLLGLTVRRPKRFAFWGHAGNLQSKGGHLTFKEKFKRWTTNRVDWWFAYTALTVTRLAAQGFPVSRISNLSNAIDTEKLRGDCLSVSEADLTALRLSLNLGPGRIGLYLGSLYEEKRIPLLLDTGAHLAKRYPDFRLVIIGDGPQRGLVMEAETASPWLRYVGPKHGREKAAFLRLADIVINPGLVGLGILDTFAAGVPIVTTDCGIHSPEIAYLESGINGVMTPNDAAAFKHGCEELLDNEPLRGRLSAAALAAGSELTIENMSVNFCDGILRALEIPA